MSIIEIIASARKIVIPSEINIYIQYIHKNIYIEVLVLVNPTYSGGRPTKAVMYFNFPSLFIVNKYNDDYSNVSALP